MEILVQQPSEIDETVTPIKFHNMYLSLYEQYNAGTLEVNEDNYLRGHIKVKTAYQSALDFLETLYGPYGLYVYMTDSSPYYDFEDINTQRGVAATWGGGMPGMTVPQMENVTLWPGQDTLRTQKYWKDAVKFNEFIYFTHLTYPQTWRIFKEMPKLEEIDCTNLTRMSREMFWKCPYLKKVGQTTDNILPNLHYFEGYVFNYCPIEHINIPNIRSNAFPCEFNNNTGEASGVGACGFYSCQELIDAHIDGFMTQLGNEIFRNCNKLETVTGLSRVTKIGNGTFRDCIKLANIDNINNVTYFDNWSLAGCQLMDFDLSNVTYAGQGSLGWTGITQANLNSITYLGGECFSGCKSLRSVRLNNNWTDYTLEYQTFYNCSALQTINLDNCKQMNRQVFYGCTSLTDVGDTSNLTKFDGSQQFYNTPSLRSVNISNIKSIPSQCFAWSGVQTVGDLTNVQRIEDYAFSHSGLTGNIALPNLELLGFRAFEYCANLTSLNIGDITYINSTEPSETFRECTSMQTFTAVGLTKICNGDLQGCSSLTTVNIPEVTYIGDRGIAWCTALTNITLPKVKTITYYGFYGSGLKTISAPVLEFVGQESFRGTKLESINMPNLKTIGFQAFYSLTDLIDLGDLSNVETVGNQAFDTCKALEGPIQLPSVISIGNWSFSYCIELTSVVLGNNCTSLGQGAFNECFNLQSINTGNITTMGRRVFYSDRRLTQLDLSNLRTLTSDSGNDGHYFHGCTQLTTVVSLENLESIAAHDAFLDDVNLVTAPISNKLKSLPAWTFRGCTSLVNVGDLSGLTHVYSRAYENCRSMNYTGTLENIVHLGSYAFNNSNIGPTLNLINWMSMEPLTSNDHGYFAGCKNLVTVNVPNLTVVPQSCFSGCSNLQNITLASNLTELGAYSIRECTSLETIDLPATVTTLKEQCLGWDTHLHVIICRATTPPTCTNAFYQSNYIQNIYVPAESVDTYKTATYWSNYAAKISAIPSNLL